MTTGSPPTTSIRSLEAGYRQRLACPQEETTLRISRSGKGPKPVLRGITARVLATGTVLLVLLMITSGCSLFRRGDGGQTLGTESVLTGEAVLVCGTECSERGQCGTADQGPVVLLSTSGPVTSGHDMAILADTPVVIERQEVRTVIQLSTSEELQVPYYMVNVPDRGQAWVAGWCVAQ